MFFFLAYEHKYIFEKIEVLNFNVDQLCLTHRNRNCKDEVDLFRADWLKNNVGSIIT